ncbi:hypothetical protein SUGI_0947860 [Cryptomeria japonica]|nr:hypothetical protein SUGI_0947860 [Cryptomeria japonica]
MALPSYLQKEFGFEIIQCPGCIFMNRNCMINLILDVYHLDRAVMPGWRSRHTLIKLAVIDNVKCLNPVLAGDVFP